MRLKLLLPPLRPEMYHEPALCPCKDCGGARFKLPQDWRKPLRDTLLSEVVASGDQRLRCDRTFRIYPTGLSLAQSSARLKGLSVLGLSYGAVALALVASPPA